METIYNIAYITILFFIYSIIGYLCEIFYCWFKNKYKFQDTGFLYGPYCPIYGFGALIIIFFLKRYENDMLILFITSMIYTSVLEYITSFLMEKIFGNKWWDYSGRKFNINGRVFLYNSFLFGICGLALVYYINPFISKYILIIPQMWQIIIASMVLILMIIDTIISSNTALVLKKKLKSIKEDVSRYIEEEYTKRMQKNKENMEEITKNIKEKIEEILSGKKSTKIQELIKKLPDTSKHKEIKVNEISIVKNSLNNDKEAKKKIK
jgi:uncharacterized membrane protein